MKKIKIYMCVLITLMASIVLMGCSSDKNTISLNDYLIITEEGYEGYGSIDVEIDFQKFSEDYLQLLDEQNLDYEVDLSNMQSFMSNCMAVPSGEKTNDDVYQRVQENTLCNGDKINYTFVAPFPLLPSEKQTGIKLTCEDFTYKMSGLKEIVEIDPFENVLLCTYGINGEGYVNQAIVSIPDVNGDMRTEYVYVDAGENNGSLSNGDMVHVYIPIPARIENLDELNEMLAKDNGVTFTRVEADVEVCGLNEYGQTNASDGERETINLNNYIKYIGPDGFNASGNVQIQVDYERVLVDYKKCLSENVSPDDLLGFNVSRVAAEYIFEKETPYYLISNSHQLWEEAVGREYVDFHDLSNGDVIELSWQCNQEGLEKLEKVMNAEFVYSDFSYTVEGLIVE